MAVWLCFFFFFYNCRRHFCGSCHIQVKGVVVSCQSFGCNVLSRKPLSPHFGRWFICSCLVRNAETDPRKSSCVKLQRLLTTYFPSLHPPIPKIPNMTPYHFYQTDLLSQEILQVGMNRFGANATFRKYPIGSPL